MNIYPTEEQKQKLINLHQTSRDHHVRDLIRNVLLYADGWTPGMIAQSQFIHETTVRRHLNDWLGIRYTVPGMTKWLYRNGFSYRKPVGIPHKFSAEAQQLFVETYNELKQKKPVTTMNLSSSSMASTRHREQNLHMAGCLREKKAQLVETTGSRTSLNIMGAMNLNDIGSTVVREYDSINSLNIARFFIAIRETYQIRQKVHIVLDQAAYHRAELVKEWAYMMNIDLHYLPFYSHNLNSIERLWKLIINM